MKQKSNFHPISLSALKRLIFSLALLQLNAVLPAMADEGSFAFRTSSTQTYSKVLGVSTVPAYVLLNKVPHQGLFIVTQPSEELGRSMKLTPGTVLLTVDSYSMTSSSVADSWISHRPQRRPLLYTFAIDNDGKPKICAGMVQPTSAPATASAAKLPTLAIGPHMSQETSRQLPTLMIGPHNSQPQASDAEVAQYQISLINQSRSKAGLGALQPDSTLTNLANQYADYMAMNYNQYDLTGSRNPHLDLMGRSAEERAQAAGISNFLEENIGRATGDGGMPAIANLHIQMMASPGHRVAILDPKARLIGIGMARSHKRFFLTQEYGE